MVADSIGEVPQLTNPLKPVLPGAASERPPRGLAARSKFIAKQVKQPSS